MQLKKKRDIGGKITSFRELAGGRREDASYKISRNGDEEHMYAILIETR